MSATDPADPASQPPPETPGASVDADNPWLGLASFTEESRAYFFGREGEVTDLTRRVQRKLLTVLFGKSGLGKTSILKAGLVPGLRAQGYFPVYLRIDYGHDSPEAAEQIKQAINHAAAEQRAAHATSGQVAPTIDPSEPIWEFLHHREVLQNSAAVPRDVPAETRTVKSAATPPIPTPIPLLIFDQFEELFTLAQSDEFGRARAARFVEELADLVENRAPKALEAKLDTDESLAERFDFSRSDYRVVIALREDYLAPLESLKKQMPSLSQNRLRLAPMTGSQALEAVLLPGNRLRPGKPLVSEEVAEAIVRFVAGGAELANAEVEPSLLSLICRELNEQRLAQGRSEISQDLLAGSHETILSNFYERSLADQPESVRRIIEDDLLTESGYRENLAEESLLKRFQAVGAAPDALSRLVNRRLLRIEERLDVRRVELTHDVLTGVVKASRDQRHEREAREATERTLAEQVVRESTARRALRRARVVAAGCTALAVAAVIAAILAVVNVQRARHAEADARQTRAVSEQARQEAEGLLGFLTDDFVDELETFGREQTIAELSQREIDYFRALPPQLKDPQAVRSGALALLNHAIASFIIDGTSKAQAEADKATAEAVGLLQQLRRDGDRSDATATVLARALGNGSTSQTDGGNLRRATDLLRPIVSRADAPTRARRTYEEALAALGWLQYLNDRNAEAVQTEREAMRMAVQLGARRQTDLTLDAGYARAESLLVDALLALGRDDEARRASEDALAVLDRVLIQRPQYGQALVTRSTLEIRLAQMAVRQLDPSDAIRFATQSLQTSLAMTKVEPQNIQYAAFVGDAYTELANAMWAAGRLRESIDYGRKAADESAHLAARASGWGEDQGLESLASSMAVTAYRQARLGDRAGVSATIAASDTVTQLGLSGGYSKVLMDAIRTYVTAALAYEGANFGAALRSAHDALAQVQAGRPANAFQASVMNFALCRLADLEGHAGYDLGEFAAAEQAERTALQACKVPSNSTVDARGLAQIGTQLAMALAREGKRSESAQTIGPVIQMYRAAQKKNHGDQWLPLDLAEALYAQSLTDAPHRAALLREATQLVHHLIPAIAALHDTEAWRARIMQAQRGPSGQTVAR